MLLSQPSGPQPLSIHFFLSEKVLLLRGGGGEGPQNCLQTKGHPYDFIPKMLLLVLWPGPSTPRTLFYPPLRRSLAWVVLEHQHPTFPFGELQGSECLFWGSPLHSHLDSPSLP